MVIWLAGVPGGKHSDREHHLRRINIKRRLITFFYKEQALITLKHFVEHEEIPPQNDVELTE